MKYRLATKEEKKAHADDKGIYPLHAIIEHDGHTLTVEDLRCWGEGDPQWELAAPRGYAFAGYDQHHMLEHTIKDVKEAATNVIEKCMCEFGSCDEYWAKVAEDAIEAKTADPLPVS